jgi:hypothetical protein
MSRCKTKEKFNQSKPLFPLPMNTRNSLRENNLNQEIQKVFDYLFMHPSHHPLVAGPGISLTVDAPFGANHK